MNFSGKIDIKKTVGERDFIYELLTRSDTDLRSAQRRIDDAVDGTETNNELKTRWRLAKSVACSDNVMFIKSPMIDELINNDLIDCKPGSLHLLHFLQIKSGWTMTAIGGWG